MTDQQQIIIDALRSQLKQLEHDFSTLETLESEQRRRLENSQKELAAAAARLQASRAALEAYEGSLQDQKG